jgi:hypothetical protein
VVSAKKSQARAKEASKLTKDLHDLTGQADWLRIELTFIGNKPRSTKLKAGWTVP